MASKLPEYMRDLVANVGDKLVADIVNDFRSYNPHPAQDPSAKVVPSAAGKVVTGDVGPAHRPIEQGTGWTTPPQVDQWKAPGIDYVDALCDEQDRRDRAQRIRELAGAEHARRLAQAAKEAEAKAHEEELKDKALKERGGKK
jgi:hypothetical protein